MLMDKNLQKLSEYYNSPAWAKKRNERLRIDGYKCARCGFTRALEVHHINYDRVFNEDVSRDLITLCKKCHNEVEKQKAERNPINFTEHHSVYLAGKISQDDWRGRFYNYRSRGLCVYDEENITHSIKNIVKVNDSLSITGPFFISCDHGCYHGDRSHGVGAVETIHSELHSEEGWGGCQGTYFTRNDVLEICKDQIDRAEIVFAYIDRSDCYGTLAEIGYAHAQGKDIVIVFSNDIFKAEMWFADKMQQRTGNISNTWINQQLLSRMQEENK